MNARFLMLALLFSGIFTADAFSQQPQPATRNQLVTVTCDIGSVVTIEYEGAENPISKADVNVDGKVEFAIPEDVEEIKVTKLSDGQQLEYWVQLGTSGSRGGV